MVTPAASELHRLTGHGEGAVMIAWLAITVATAAALQRIDRPAGNQKKDCTDRSFVHDEGVCPA